VSWSTAEDWIARGLAELVERTDEMIRIRTRLGVTITVWRGRCRYPTMRDLSDFPRMRAQDHRRPQPRGGL
jgi:hypothetical protein